MMLVTVVFTGFIFIIMSFNVHKCVFLCSDKNYSLIINEQVFYYNNGVHREPLKANHLDNSLF